MHRPQGWVSPVLLVDGRIDGVWRHERRARRVEVRVTPFGKVAARVRRAVEDEVVRLSTYFDAEAQLTWDL